MHYPNTFITTAETKNSEPLSSVMPSTGLGGGKMSKITNLLQLLTNVYLTRLPPGLGHFWISDAVTSNAPPPTIGPSRGGFNLQRLLCSVPEGYHLVTDIE